MRSTPARPIVAIGFTAERIVTGEADIAIQQLSELKQVKGVEIVGSLPHHLQDAGGIFRRPDDGVEEHRSRRSAFEVSGFR